MLRPRSCCRAPHARASSDAWIRESAPLVGGGFAPPHGLPCELASVLSAGTVGGRRERKAVPSKSQQLVRRFSELNEAAEHVGTVLMRYNKASASVATLVEQGAHLVTALQNFGGPERRSEVTDALGELEAARHRVRLAMFALAKEQGSSASDLARALGISRQLASRLATEAEETHR